MSGRRILDLPLGDPIPGYQAIPAPRLALQQSDLVYAAAGGAVVQSAALGPNTIMIRLVTWPSGTALGARVWIGVAFQSPGFPMPSGAIEYFRCYPGEFVWAISQDVNTGMLMITECGSKANFQ